MQRVSQSDLINHLVIGETGAKKASGAKQASRIITN